MEALRIVKTITSDRLPELNKYKGKSVEIIILLDSAENNKNLDLLNEFRGSCPNLPDGLEFQNEIRQEWER